MDIFNLFTLIGGLALFLYGMNVMGEGLEKQAGSKLKVILEKLTNSPYKGFLVGLIVTSIIQSSSATTVMVVGFVNSGIMRLNQAIGIIMGANVGTTVTAWILSLTGLEGDSFWIQLVKPSSFSPLLAGIGIVMVMFMKSRSSKNIGSILLGFAILMFGMETMTGAVEPLADVPEFQQIFLMFQNPILGVLAGAVLTGIIQSSSASVGILQALSVTGTVTFGAALPIIMGQNIGTCVTALISSVGTNRNAKRAAIVHLYFNIIGTVLFLSLFYLVNAFVHFPFLESSINQVGIAIVHTSFNLLSTAVMLPFTKGLERLAYWTIKDTDEAEQFQMLDERLLATPSVAVNQCTKLTHDMADITHQALVGALDSFENFDAKRAVQIEEWEGLVDTYEDKLGTYMVKLSGVSLSMQDSHQLSVLLHTIGDFERISDHAVNILRSSQEMHDKKIHFSPEAQNELRILMEAVDEIIGITFRAFEEESSILGGQVEPLEQVIDGMTAEMKSRHIARLQHGLCTIELGFIFNDFLTNFSRVADHCSNIAVAVIQIGKDVFDTHSYLDDVKTAGGPEYMSLYESYQEKYMLPAAEF